MHLIFKHSTPDCNIGIHLPQGLKLLLLCLILAGCKNNYSPQLEPSAGFPRWLKSESAFTQQTSGIAFIGKDSMDVKHFLLTDDIGKIHRLSISQDTIFILNSINFSDTLTSTLRSMPRQDFEEIVYDRIKNETYVSLEGHTSDLHEAGIYKVLFYQNDPFSDSILSLEKLNIVPAGELTCFIANNIGFEGIALDENNIYLGLEGFSSDGVFADSTLMYIVSRNDLHIKKVINTKSLGIHTICGLFSDGKNSIIGIDRNNKKFFHFLLDDSGEIIKFKSSDLNSNIPGYPNLQYTASLEGITVDDEYNIYMVDDPWKKFFIPSGDILQRLNDDTKENFRNFIPVIYKFKYK